MKTYPFFCISASIASLGWAGWVAFNEESFLLERRRVEVRVQRFSFPMLVSSLPRVTCGLNQHETFFPAKYFDWRIWTWLGAMTRKCIVGSNRTPKSSKLYFCIFIFQRLRHLETNWLNWEFIVQTWNLAYVICDSSSSKPCVAF